MISINTAERWKKVRLSSLFYENVSKNTDFAEQKAFQFYFGTIVPKKEYELTEELIETYKKYTLIEPGDIMINGKTIAELAKAMTVRGSIGTRNITLIYSRLSTLKNSFMGWEQA